MDKQKDLNDNIDKSNMFLLYGDYDEEGELIDNKIDLKVILTQQSLHSLNSDKTILLNFN